MFKFFVNANQPSSSPLTGYVSQSYSGRVSAISDIEMQDIPIVSIPGIHYLPREKENILAIPVDNEYLCVGSIDDSSPSIQPGELLLKSTGNAFIKLCNNGDVVINGLTININGQII